MRFSTPSSTGLTSVLLCLSALAQLSGARPSGATAPKIKSSRVLGASHDEPRDHFIATSTAPAPTLPADMYQPTINRDLATSPQYSSIYKGSGSLRYTKQSKSHLKKLKFKPRLSRDGGLGGKISGRNVFIFADTETYSPSGDWKGIVSNSAATNGGHQAKKGEPPVLHDRLGEWSNDEAGMRNFVPFTDGEAAYNAKMEGEGQRYAVWPQSSVIPLDADSALLYAPIVFINNKVTNSDGLPLTKNAGVTLLKVTIPGKGGPVAERVNPMIFYGSPDVQWGVLGGIHGWGPSAANGGKVYILANNNKGLMLGRVDVEKVSKRDAYEFWHKDGSWSSTAPAMHSDDTFIDGSFKSVDIFYSPRHKTFINVFMDGYANSIFYWQYLQTPHPIDPSSKDYVENITKHPWSEPKVLLKIPHVPAGQFAYSGGMYRGYFDKDDVSVGGDKMLLGWVQPTGKPAGSKETAYQHMSAEVTFA